MISSIALFTALLLIFAGQNLIKAAVVNDESSSGEVFDRRFIDFIEDALGLKVPTIRVKTADSPEQTKSDQATNQPEKSGDSLFNIDIFEKSQQSQPTQDQPESLTTPQSWWDKIFDNFESIFFNQTDPRKIEASSNIEAENSVSTQAPGQSQEQPILLDIDPNGVMFRNFATANIPPPADFPIDSTNKSTTNDSKQQSSSESEEKQVFKVSMNESEENSLSNNEEKSIDNFQTEITGDKFLAEVLKLGFCQAKCVEQCITVSLKELDECKAICRTNNLQELCSQNDAPCLKACSVDPTDSNFKAPEIYDIHIMLDEPSQDKFEISWSPMPDAVIYAVAIIADENSVKNGALQLVEDVTNTTSFVFQKQDLCYSYKIMVSAIYKDGISPYSAPKILKPKAGRLFADLTMQKGAVSWRTIESDSSYMALVEVEVSFTNQKTRDLISRLLTINSLRASSCRDMAMAEAVFGAKTNQDGHIPVTDAQFLFLKDRIIIRMPALYATMGCNYEYTLINVLNRCGDLVDLEHVDPKMRPKASIMFGLDCKDIPDYTDCQNQQKIAQDYESNDLSSQTQLPNCQPKDFSVQLQPSSENQFNATISWLPVTQDPKPSFYVIRYGPIVRKLVREPGMGLETQQPETSLWTLNDDDVINDRLYFKPPRPLTPKDLFSVQICFFWRQEDLAPFNWALVPRFVLDLAAAKANIIQDEPRGVIIDPQDQDDLLLQNGLVTVEYPSVNTVPRVYKAIDEYQGPDGMVSNHKSPYSTEFDWLNDWKSMPSWQDLLFGLFMTFMAIWTLVYLAKKYCLKSSHLKPIKQKHQPMIFVSRADSVKNIKEQPIAANKIAEA